MTFQRLQLKLTSINIPMAEARASPVPHPTTTRCTARPFAPRMRSRPSQSARVHRTPQGAPSAQAALLAEKKAAVVAARKSAKAMDVLVCSLHGGPVGLEHDGREAALLDEALCHRLAHTIELLRPVRRLAEEHDAAVCRDAVHDILRPRGGEPIARGAQRFEGRAQWQRGNRRGATRWRRRRRQSRRRSGGWRPPLHIAAQRVPQKVFENLGRAKNA